MAPLSSESICLRSVEAMGYWGCEGYGRVSSIALQRVQDRGGGISLPSNRRAPSGLEGFM
jgi:hypothetical protein